MKVETRILTHLELNHLIFGHHHNLVCLSSSSSICCNLEIHTIHTKAAYLKEAHLRVSRNVVPNRTTETQTPNHSPQTEVVNVFLRDATANIILIKTKTKTQSLPSLRFFGIPVSVAASSLLISVLPDGTKLGLERSTSKMASGNVATRARA
jgi:hypothetical protein